MLSTIASIAQSLLKYSTNVRVWQECENTEAAPPMILNVGDSTEGLAKGLHLIQVIQ
jgi:hypothetical protein